jgi:cell division protein FtsL
MITPEAQMIIDKLEKEVQTQKAENDTLKKQIEDAKKAVEESGNDDIFGGIFN